MSRKSPLLAGSNLERLLHWCRSQAELDVAGIETFLRVLQPTPSLAEFHTVLENIKVLHPLLIQANAGRWHSKPVTAFLKLADALLQDHELLRSFTSSESGRPASIEGAIMLHPVHSALALTLPPDRADVTPPHREAFRWLQAYFLDAVVKVHKPVNAPLDEHGAQLRDWEGYSGQMVAAERSVRYVARGTCPINVLALIPKGEHDRKALYTALEKAGQTGPKGQSQRFAQRLEAFFALTDQHREVRAVSSRVGSAEPSESDDEKYSQEIEELGEDEGAFIKKLPRKDTKRLTNAGLAMEDAYEVTANFDSGDTIDVASGDSTPLAKERSASALRASTKRAQLLPYSSERMSAFEIQVLDQELRKLANATFVIESLPSAGFELAAFLGLCLWTGIEAERVLESRVIEGNEAAPRMAEPKYPYLLRASFRLSPPLNILRDPAPAEPQWIADGIVAAVVPRLLLPLHPEVVSLIEPLVTLRESQTRATVTAGQRTWRLFTTDVASRLPDLAQRFLKHLQRKTGHQGQITMSRANRHFYLLLARITGDLADAALITGRKPHEISSAPHYYAPRTAYLCQAYLSASEEQIRMYRGVTGARPDTNPVPATLPPDDERVGALILLQDAYLQTLVLRLAGNVTAAAGALARQKTIANWVAFHNALTTYCVLKLCFCTGIRVIDNPFASLDDIEPTSRALVIADKIHSHASSTRVVWLTAGCDRQLTQYREHLANLGEYLTMLGGRRFAEALAADSPGFRGANLPAGRRPTRLRTRTVKVGRRHQDRQPSLPLFFYLTEFADDWEKVGESTLTREIHGFHPVPVNAHRHYLRTRLRELGVPGEAVDTFMGHGGIGHEPFGRFSSLAPAELRDATLPAVEKLMSRAGWRVLPGNPARYPR